MNTINKIDRLHVYLKDKLVRSRQTGNEIAILHNETTLEFFEIMFSDELKEIASYKQVVVN